MKIFRMIALLALLIVSLFSCSLDNPVIEKEQDLQTTIQMGTGLDPSRYYVFDDIIYDRTEPVHRNAIAELTGQLDTSRGLKINTHTLWPNGVVNYYFGNTFTSTEKAVIARAMKTIELACAVRFVLTTAGDYRYKISKITSTTIGGQSTLGYIKSPFCELASVNYGTTMHEFLHGLAISHEHNRPDRPVTINTANINPDYLSQFNIVSSTSATTYYEYDYDSIMHYGAYAFSINGKKTIEAGTNAIGQRDHLSVNDRRTLLTLYPFPANKYFRLKNRWTNFYMHTENQYSWVQMSSIQTYWHSAQWIIENHVGYMRFKNRWTNLYMHNEANSYYVQVGTIQPYWWSADWSPEDHEGFLRLKNRWTANYTHTENNYSWLQLGTIGAGWWSADWTLEAAN